MPLPLCRTLASFPLALRFLVHAALHTSCSCCLWWARWQAKRLHLLLTMSESAGEIPGNLEARRRIEFFTNSLFMRMPTPPLVADCVPFWYAAHLPLDRRPSEVPLWLAHDKPLCSVVQA